MSSLLSRYRPPRPMKGALLSALLLLGACKPATPPAPASPQRETSSEQKQAVEIRQHRFAEVGFRVVSVDLRRADVRLIRQGANGQTLSTFAQLEAAMKAEGRTLLAATNAGIFKRDAAEHPLPEGLFVQDGVTLTPLNREEGQGNFYWKPNGVFFLREDGAGIATRDRFSPQGVLQATQSGPLLFDPEGLHEGFEGSSSRKELRSAVGVDARDPHRVYFVLASDPSRFQTLAAFMREELGCTSALYLDGVISQLWTPAAADRNAPAPSDYAGFLAVTARR